MKISHFMAMQAVTASGSFSGAALELDCTQSNISHAIKELERHTGCRIFTRSKTGCTPTTEGHEVILRGVRIVELFQELRNLRVEVAGSVRITCLRSVGEALLSRLLEECWIQHKDIRISIENDSECHDFVVQTLRQNKSDISITHPVEDNDFICQALPIDPFMLVVPKAPKPIRTDSLTRLGSLLYLEHPSTCTRKAIEQLAGLEFLRKDPVFRTTCVKTILSMVQRGKFYSVLPRLSLPVVTKDVDVLQLPAVAHRELVIATRPYLLLSPAARAVLSILRKLKFESEQYSDSATDAAPAPTATASRSDQA
jgi:DNA-binding transcriptional LysR family regulator